MEPQKWPGDAQYFRDDSCPFPPRRSSLCLRSGEGPGTPGSSCRGSRRRRPGGLSPSTCPQCARWEGVVRVREPGHRALLEFRGPVYPIDVTGQQVLGEGSCRKAGGLGDRPEQLTKAGGEL